MDRGIHLVTRDWWERLKHWLFAYGATLNEEDGSLVVPPPMQEVSRNVVTVIKEAKVGTFESHRENDELTTALQKP
jgi:hypothetical protein